MPRKRPTAKEQAVLDLIARGQNYNQIAALLGLDRGTVYRRTNDLSRRLGCATTGQLLVLAGQNGWCEVTDLEQRRAA